MVKNSASKILCSVIINCVEDNGSKKSTVVLSLKLALHIKYVQINVYKYELVKKIG